MTGRRLSRRAQKQALGAGIGAMLAIFAVSAWPSAAGAAAKAPAKADAGGVTLSAAPLGIDVSMLDSTVDNKPGGTPLVTGVVAKLKAAGVNQLHYGGGSYADLYNWETDRLLGDNFNAALDFTEVSKDARALGGQSFVTVNYGSGSPALAAAWVKKSIDTSGDAVADWAIGNENYGCWEKDQYLATCPGLGAQSLATSYAKHALAYMKAMKAVDPKAQIGVPWAFDATVGGAAVPDNEIWNDTVLGADEADINFVDAHWYPYNGLTGNLGAGANPTAETVIQTVETIPSEMAKIETTLGTYDPGAKVIVGETGVSNLATNATCTAVGALFAAGDALEWLAAGAQSIDWWPVDTTSNLTSSCTHPDEGMFTNTGAELTPYAGYLLASQLAQPHARLSALTTADPNVLEFQSVLPDGQVAVAFINTYTGAPAPVSIAGTALSGGMTVQEYSAGNQNSTNTKIATGTTSAAAIAGGITLPAESILVLKTLKPSAVTVSTGATEKAGTRFTIKGKLTLNGAAAPAGLTVRITRQMSGTTKYSDTLSAKTVAGGTYTATDLPPAYGSYVYTASYPSSTYGSPSRSVAVRVTPAKPNLKLAVSATSVRPGTKVKVTATLAAPHVNRTLAIYAVVQGKAKKLIKTGTINSKGQLSVTYTVTANTTFQVTFSGDTWYSSAYANAVVKA